MPPKTLTFADVRKIGLTLPEVEEGTAYGAFALKLRKKLFTCTAINKSAEPNSLLVRLGMAERDELLKAEPDVYYVTSHYEPYPCVVVRLSKIRRDALRELLGASWRYVMESTPQRAPKKKTKKKSAAKPGTSERQRRRA
jgi:hypothetical protein